MQWSRLLGAGIIVIMVVVFASGSDVVAQDSALVADIESLVSLGEDVHPSFARSIQDRIQENPADVIQTFLPKIGDPTTGEKNLAVYVWALGATGDPQVVGDIIALCDKSESEVVSRSCLHALVAVGNDKSGEYILGTLDKTEGDNERFEILNLLAQMQYEPALPKTIEILKKDFQQFYWQPIFIFGKYGDMAVPMLMEKLTDKNDNIRGNTINVLGQWLIPPDAAGPFMDQYWKENKPEFRSYILSSLEYLLSDPDTARAFFKEVIAKEKKSEVKKFAEGSLSSFEMMEQALDSVRSVKNISAEEFQKQYDRFYSSAGKEGDHALLIKSSSVADEPKLKKLRERILQRNSDESFYDYQNVNYIIVLNRILDSSQ